MTSYAKRACNDLSVQDQEYIEDIITEKLELMIDELRLIQEFTANKIYEHEANEAYGNTDRQNASWVEQLEIEIGKERESYFDIYES